MRRNVYLGRPFTGCAVEEVMQYYKVYGDKLRAVGLSVMSPIVAHEEIANTGIIKPVGYEEHAHITNKAIVRRDFWYVDHASFVLLDFTEASKVSIGGVSELCRAHTKGVHTIVVMEDENVHQHAFVKEMADVVFKSIDQAIEYLGRIMKGMEA